TSSTGWVHERSSSPPSTRAGSDEVSLTPAAYHPEEPTGPADLYAPFRPLATRIVSFVLIVWLLGGAVAFVVMIQRLEHPPLSYQVGVVTLAVLISAFLYLMGSVRAVPSAEGRRVRTILRSAVPEAAPMGNVCLW